MSPDPGNDLSVQSSETICEISSDLRLGTSRHQRTMVCTENTSVCDESGQADLATLGPSTSSDTFRGSLAQAPLPVAPNPRRHRQRLASHYMSQIRESQSWQVCATRRTPSTALHHYYHPYHQHHHHHLHYPQQMNGFLSRATSSHSPQENQSTRSSQRARSSERSPFLMVKILLFSLMTIDFVMNTIGLAVIVVMAKNHYNNLAVERSLHPPPPLDKSAPPPEDPYRSQYNHPQYGNEWSIVMPLLPSFIFVEVLTLVGMFGVFCDLFSFTMTYAILKLITSLCYPSMASAAAVAAMATATGTGSMLSGVSANNVSPSLLPLPLPENFTLLLNQAKLLNNLSSTTLSPLINPIDKLTHNEPELSTTSASSTILPEPGQAEWSTLSSSLLTTEVPTVILSTTTESFKNYKHTRLKHDKLMASMKQVKKSEKIAKLKQREKQLRSKLLRMESAESSSMNESARWMALGPASHARISLILPPSSTDSLEGSAGSTHQHNIKYHHRVWDALLVTFEVIFAVAFAFNTLTTSHRRSCRAHGDRCEEEGEASRRWRPLRRNRGSVSRFSWPYSPLTSSIDAFYFAQFQLPPPPPPYFGSTQLASSSTGQRSTPQRSTSMSINEASSGTAQSQISRGEASTNRSRSLLEPHNWRRFTPSWMSTSCARRSNEPVPLTRSPSIRSNPPLYEDIDQDQPVVIMTDNRDRPEQPVLSTAALSSAPERIVLQVISQEQPVLEGVPCTESSQCSVSVTSVESTNLPNRTKTDNVTNIQVASNESEPSTHSTVSSSNKTLVISVNDTRV